MTSRAVMRRWRESEINRLCSVPPCLRSGSSRSLRAVSRARAQRSKMSDWSDWLLASLLHSSAEVSSRRRVAAALSPCRLSQSLLLCLCFSLWVCCTADLAVASFGSCCGDCWTITDVVVGMLSGNCCGSWWAPSLVVVFVLRRKLAAWLSNPSFKRKTNFIGDLNQKEIFSCQQ